jgi:hypothetical protein
MVIISRRRELGTTLLDANQRTSSYQREEDEGEEGKWC